MAHRLHNFFNTTIVAHAQSRNKNTYKQHLTTQCSRQSMWSRACLLLESIHIRRSEHNNAQIKSSSTFKSASRFRFHDGKSRRFALKCLQQMRIVRNVSAFFRTWISSRCQNTLKKRTRKLSHYFIFGSSRSVHGLYKCHCLNSNIAEFRLHPRLPAFEQKSDSQILQFVLFLFICL